MALKTKKIKRDMLRISVSSIEEFYGLGVVFAAQHFVHSRPDWYSRVPEGLFYATTWPFVLFNYLKTMTSY